MVDCYTKSIPSTKAVKDQENNVEKCTKHHDINFNYICANVECDFKMFCMKCRKDHQKTCSRPEMVFTKQTFKDHFYEEYYELNESVIDQKISQVQDLGETMKTKFSKFIDVMVKHWENEILCLTKESLSKFAKEQLQEKLESYKSKRTKYLINKR